MNVETVETASGPATTALIGRLKGRGAIVAETTSHHGPPPAILLVVRMPDDAADRDACAALLRAVEG